jgi:hypothetical protein
MATLQSMPNLKGYVLATGDSDFSHLFCHLRQSGCNVIGVGPRSALSEIVKNTADKFVYTDRGTVKLSDKPSELQRILRKEAFDTLERTLKSKNSTRGWLYPSEVKAAMESLDSSFDFRELGYVGFLHFLKASGKVKVIPDGKCSYQVCLVDALISTEDIDAQTLEDAPGTERSALDTRVALCDAETVVETKN